MLASFQFAERWSVLFYFVVLIWLDLIGLDWKDILADGMQHYAVYFFFFPLKQILKEFWREQSKFPEKSKEITALYTHPLPPPLFFFTPYPSFSSTSTPQPASFSTRLTPSIIQSPITNHQPPHTTHHTPYSYPILSHPPSPLLISHPLNSQGRLFDVSSPVETARISIQGCTTYHLSPLTYHLCISLCICITRLRYRQKPTNKLPFIIRNHVAQSEWVILKRMVGDM